MISLVEVALVVSAFLLQHGPLRFHKVVDRRQSSSLLASSSIFAQAEDLEIANLLGKAGYDVKRAKIEPIAADSAFCNRVFKVRIEDDNKEDDEDTTIMVAKLFSELALCRMDPARQVGEIEELVGSQGLGPRVYARSSRGILAAYIDGKVLTEDDIRQRDSRKECGIVGKALGRLHDIKADFGVNMLWRSCETMLSMSDPDYNHGGWTIARLERAVYHHRQEFDTLGLSLVSTGHGDFKPANILLLPERNEAKLIDLELVGTHYRGYDLAKFLRCSARDSPFAEGNRRAFYESYLEASSDTNATIQSLSMEAARLLPLTWLEAAIFFVCMSHQDPKQEKRWKELALSRLENYEASL